MGGDADVPKQITELMDDITSLGRVVRNVEYVLGTGDLREFEIPEDLDKLPNFRREIDALESRIEDLVHDIQEDFQALEKLEKRIAALESSPTG